VGRRLFVALEPDPPVRAGLVAAVEALRRTAGPAAGALRWSAPATVHLTLRFLRDVAEPRLGEVMEAVAATARSGSPLALELRGAGAFPTARRARVVWLGVSGDVGPLAILAAELERRLAPLGFPAEDRPFAPHLTVARARPRRGATGLAPALEAALAGSPPLPWKVTELVLFESHLEPGGARHVPLVRAALGPHHG
jgi:2'-5' RNA ligase